MEEYIYKYLIMGFCPKYTNNSDAAQHQKPHNQMKKWTEDLNRRFSKNDLQMANRHM